MNTPTPQKTLAQRLIEGKIPVPEALHCAMSLADALRKIHDAGRSHGALTPSAVLIGGSGVELTPTALSHTVVTPYTAPEVLQGKTADARSDIFAFGAIVFEMLTGRQAFEGDGQTALKLALTVSAPPSSGSPVVDRLVSSCVAKDPAARWQRMQKIIMELKLLTVAVRRADAPAPARGQAEAEIRAQIERLEARMTARIEAHEKSMAQMQEVATEALHTLRGQLTSVATEIASTQERLSQPAPEFAILREQIVAVVQTIGALGQRIDGLEQNASATVQRIDDVQVTIGGVGHRLDGLQQTVGAVGQRLDGLEQTVGAVGQRLDGVEQGLDEMRRQSSTLQENLAADMRQFEQVLRTQAGSIESARTAMAQTDDLVERVVEALELLQSSVLEQQDDRAALVN